MTKLGKVGSIMTRLIVTLAVSSIFAVIFAYSLRGNNVPMSGPLLVIDSIVAGFLLLLIVELLFSKKSNTRNIICIYAALIMFAATMSLPLALGLYSRDSVMSCIFISRLTIPMYGLTLGITLLIAVLIGIVDILVKSRRQQQCVDAIDS